MPRWLPARTCKLTSFQQLRRILIAMIMPCALLTTQQGARLLELKHLEASVANTGEMHLQATDDDLCSACLALARLAGIANPEVVALANPASLSFHHSVQPVTVAADAQPSAQRKRGPPSFL